MKHGISQLEKCMIFLNGLKLWFQEYSKYSRAKQTLVKKPSHVNEILHTKGKSWANKHNLRARRKYTMKF